MIAISTCCSSTLNKSTTEESSERPGEIDSCSIFQGSYAESLSVRFWALEVPSLGVVYANDSWSLQASRWDPSVTKEIQMGFSPWKPGSIRVDCVLVSARALYMYSCGSDVSGYQIHTVQKLCLFSTCLEAEPI